MAGILVVTASYDQSIRFWDANTQKPYRALQHKESQVNKLEITPDRKYIVAAGNPSIRAYEVRTNNPLPAFAYSGHTNNITSIGFQKDSKWMFSSSEDQTVKVWDLGGTTCQREFKFTTAVTCAALHPNQAEIMCGFQDGSVRIINLVASRVTRVCNIDTDSSIRSVAISPDGRMATACSSEGQCFFWDLPRQDCSDLLLRPTFAAHNTYIIKCAFSPNSQFLVTTSADSSAKIWHTNTLQLDKTLTGHQQWVWDAAFSADSAYLLTGGSDRKACLWDLAQGDVCRQYSGHSKPISCIALNDLADSPH